MERGFIIEGLTINPPIADNFCLVKDLVAIKKLGFNDKEYLLKIKALEERVVLSS